MQRRSPLSRFAGALAAVSGAWALPAIAAVPTTAPIEGVQLSSGGGLEAGHRVAEVLQPYAIASDLGACAEASDSAAGRAAPKSAPATSRCSPVSRAESGG